MPLNGGVGADGTFDLQDAPCKSAQPTAARTGTISAFAVVHAKLKFLIGKKNKNTINKVRERRDLISLSLSRGSGSGAFSVDVEFVGLFPSFLSIGFDDILGKGLVKDF